TSISTTGGDKKGSRETSLHKNPFWLENFVMKRFEFRVSGLTEEDAKRWDKQQRREPGQGIAAQAHALVLCAVGAAAVYFVDHSLSKPPPPPLNIVQTIPPQGSTAMPACAPAVFFLNRPYLGDIKHSLHVTDASGKEYDLTVDSEVMVVKSHVGNPIVVLAPRHSYPAGAGINAQIRHQDAAGKTMMASSVAFTTGAGEAEGPASAMQLELGGWRFSGLGDYGLIPESGDVKPVQGDRMAALSTGSVLGKSALGGTTSILSIGPISLNSERVTLAFAYDFISSEFDDWVGKKYDDAFLVVVSGPRGAAAQLVTSVDQIGKEASTPIIFPGMPKPGELPPQQSGWQPYSISANVGSPTCISFLLTDVGDEKFTSVVTLGDIRINESNRPTAK
ncbi:MAG: hypothetical protein ACREUA_10460, partial [Burkholderiales bacterium]